jgi:hypothetical protein
LNQWSQAVDELEHWAGANASMLPPGAGGGTRNVRGTWYVNGEPWTLSELFTVNRVNTMAEIDRMVSDSLNVIAANNEATKALTGLMTTLFRKNNENNWTVYPKVPWSWISDAGRLEASSDSFAKQVLISGQALDYPVSGDQLLAYARKFLGSGSTIEKAYNLGPGQNTAVSSGVTPTSNGSTIVSYSATVGLAQEDFRAMIDEVEQIIGAFAADNQVAQLRNETLFNSRSNLLEGLGTFIKGQQTTRSTLARNA